MYRSVVNIYDNSHFFKIYLFNMIVNITMMYAIVNQRYMLCIVYLCLHVYLCLIAYMVDLYLLYGINYLEYK